MSRPHEPLTPEERELAAQLARLGPHGGPSPQLDARILAAARAAVDAPQPAPASSAPPARVPRSRWPLGLGVAASVLLAAGVAWQLRPVHEVPVASEAPASAAYGAVEAADEGAAEAANAAAPAMEAAPAAAPAQAPVAPMAPETDAATPPPPGPASDPARRNAEAAARQPAPPRRSPLSMIPAVPGLTGGVEAPAAAPPAPRIVAPQAFPPPAAAEQDRLPLGQGIVAAPAAVPTPAADTAAMQVQERALAERHAREQAMRAATARESADAARTLDSIATPSARIRSEDAARKAGKFATPAPAPASAPPPPPPAPVAESHAYGETASLARDTLRRTELQVPVDEDARLDADEWLDRIRLRRDLGDAANAARSLRLFVQEHPFQRIPDDLRPLLESP